jgi:hypothetical protein
VLKRRNRPQPLCSDRGEGAGLAWRLYLSEFYAPIAAAQPHAGYHAIARLEREKFGESCTVVTMNVDSLHSAAGGSHSRCYVLLHASLNQCELCMSVRMRVHSDVLLEHAHNFVKRISRIRANTRTHARTHTHTHTICRLEKSHPSPRISESGALQVRINPLSPSLRLNLVPYCCLLATCSQQVASNECLRMPSEFVFRVEG